MLEDLFSELDLCILNDGSAACIHPATGSTSALDLSVCVPSLVLVYEGKLHEHLCGSDHFPVILTSNTVEKVTAPKRWNLKRRTGCPSAFYSFPTNGGSGHVCGLSLIHI